MFKGQSATESGPYSIVGLLVIFCFGKIADATRAQYLFAFEKRG